MSHFSRHLQGGFTMAECVFCLPCVCLSYDMSHPDRTQVRPGSKVKLQVCDVLIIMYMKTSEMGTCAWIESGILLDTTGYLLRKPESTMPVTASWTPIDGVQSSVCQVHLQLQPLLPERWTDFSWTSLANLHWQPFRVLLKGKYQSEGSCAIHQHCSLMESLGVC